MSDEGVMGDERLQQRATEAAGRVAGRLAGEGAVAVVLMGSFARGVGRTESDVDLVAIGDGAPYRLEREEPFLVSVSWRSEAEVLREFERPELVGTVVPGWREAVVLDDRDGAAARLKAAAEGWAWDSIVEEANRWASEQVVGHAEEVHKIARTITAPTAEAAVLAPLLAFRMAKVVAVRRRMLYQSERELPGMVSTEMGDEWRRAFEAAVGMNDERLRERMGWALEVYRMAAVEVGRVLDDRERAVVEHAVRLAETMD